MNMPSILHRGNGNFFCPMQPPLRHREHKTPRKFRLPQHMPVVFYLIRKRQDSPQTGAGSKDTEQKCFCTADILGKFPHFFASAAPAVLPASCATETQFLRFYRGVNPCRYAVYKFKFLHYIYSFSGFVYTFFTPCISCVSFEDRYFVLLFRFSAFSLCPHRLFVFRSVFRPSRRGRFAFPRCVSLDGPDIPLGLCTRPVRFHSSPFSFSRTQTVRHPPCMLLVPLSFRRHPIILCRKCFPAFQRQSMVLCFSSHSCSPAL